MTWSGSTRDVAAALRDRPARCIVLVAIALAGAVLALTVPTALSSQRSGATVSVSAPPDGANRTTRTSRRASARGRAPLFFGFREFAWDPDAGVPGFDLPDADAPPQ